MAEILVQIPEIEPTRLRQLNRHTGDGPGDTVGDCFRTVIACLLGLSDAGDVPHFVEQNLQQPPDEAGWHDVAAARRWLRVEHDLDLVVLDRAEADRAGCHYLATVRSHAGPWNHSVMARKGEVVWCPSGGAYSLADAVDHLALVVCFPYAPPPDELLHAWRQHAAQEATRRG